jgi:HTH-type transcriptional regulator/antitoxin MqsA
MTTCLLCDSENTSLHSFNDEINYKGEKLNVELQEIRCDSCGFEFIPKDLILSNEYKIREAKRLADKLLTSEEIKTIRSSLSLTQEQAATIFGGGRNAFSKYERSEVIQSVAMDRLMRISSKYPHILNELKILSGIETERSVFAFTIDTVPYHRSKPANQVSLKSEKDIRHTRTLEVELHGELACG